MPRIKKKNLPPLKVTKVHLDHVPVYPPQKFPPLNNLYLELLENKAKVKPNLRKKEFNYDESTMKIMSRVDSMIKPEPEAHEKEKPPDGDHKEDEHKEDDRHSRHHHHHHHHHSGEDHSHRHSERHHHHHHSGSRRSSRRATPIEPKEEEPNIVKFLKETDEPKISAPPPPEAIPPQEEAKQPKLSELTGWTTEHKGASVRELNPYGIDASPEEAEKRSYLELKFDILRKEYKDRASEIPRFTKFTPVTQIEKEYANWIRRLRLDSKVADYKKYLLYICMVMETFLVKVVGLDAKGFTQNQMSHMSSYEALLVELGEQNFLEPDKDWPVLVRLIAAMGVNAVIFIGTKYFMSGMLPMLNNFLGGGGGSTAIPAAPIPETMPGPPDAEIDSVLEAVSGKTEKKPDSRPPEPKKQAPVEGNTPVIKLHSGVVKRR